MLKYFVQTAQALLTMSLLAGLLTAYVRRLTDKWGLRWAGILGGLAGSIAMAVLKNATNKIDTGLWNLRIFAAFLIAMVVFFVFSALSGKLKKASVWVRCIALDVMCAVPFVYALPDVFTYPYSILLVEKSVLSTTFLFKLVGILLGLILMIVLALAVAHSSARLGDGEALLLTSLGIGVQAAFEILACIRIMTTKRIIASNHTLFTLIKFSSNHSNLFIYLTMAVIAVIPVLLWIRSFRVNEPYSNPAQHRKIRAKWRNIRRWATTALVCLALGVVTLTALNAIANRPVELSPVEDAPVVDGNVVVDFSMVEDGHLHRFAYVADSGKKIRFIVIKKPNSSAYGIGLDACDICGETGYYEKDGQVVCKLCDVVMNINTIGFKGGCNPIVIPYTIESGKILVPVEGLLEYESEFKSQS